MTHENLRKPVPLSISAGHLVVLWDVLSNKLSGSIFMDSLTEEERRALWAAQDLFELALQGNGVSARPAVEWERLVKAARAHVSQLPVEYRDCEPPQ